MIDNEQLTSRLTNLELLFTHLERQVVELNDVLLAQQRKVDVLAKQVERLQFQGEEPDEAAGDDFDS